MNYQFSCKNWQILKLNEICIIKSGILTSSHHCTSQKGNFPYVKPKDISFNTITCASEQISEEIIRKAGVEIVPKDSILLAVSGPNAGNIALLGTDAVVNENVIYATIRHPLIKPKLLYYYLLLKRHMLVKVSNYGLRVSYRYLQKLEIPIPSLKEQNQIIQYLDLHLNQINISISQIKKAFAQIDRDRQQLLNQVFLSNPAGNSFPGWETLKLKDCGVIQAGRTPNGAIKAYYGSDYPLFKPSDFQQQFQLKNAETYLSAKGLKEARYVRANSLLICSRGINLGTVGITQVDGACSQQIISFTPNENFIPEFVYFQMNSDSFKEQLLKQSKNSIVNKSAFINLSLAVINLDHQRSIVNKLSSEISLLAKKENNIYKKLHSLDDAKCDFLLRAFPTDLLI